MGREPEAEPQRRRCHRDGSDFQNGDCRNGVRTTITDAHVNYLVQQFDTYILPLESESFSVAPSRNGFRCSAGRTVPASRPTTATARVVLIDNVRDDNFYDLNNTQGLLVHRRLLLVPPERAVRSQHHDASTRSTGSTGREQTRRTSRRSDLCTSAARRPFLYEGVFAHEYQHLLEYYENAAEQSAG